MSADPLRAPGDDAEAAANTNPHLGAVRDRATLDRRAVESGPADARRVGGIESRAGEAVDVIRLGPYRLVQRLGEGGMGVVHLALDPNGRAVAVKVLRPHIAHDPDARARLSREVDTLSRMRSPRVAPIVDSDVDGDTPYLVTRYVPGPGLDAYVDERGPLAPGALHRVAEGLAEALDVIHSAGVVHRDIKPGNVLLVDGDPVLIDFGIAHVVDDVRLTMTGLVMGTPGYLAPEVVAGDDVTAATDWWGWAATMAFAATGTPPFGRGAMHTVLARVVAGEPDLGAVDPRIEPLLYAALSPEPGERPHRSEVIAALERYAQGAPVTDAIEVRRARATQLLDVPRTAVLPQDAPVLVEPGTAEPAIAEPVRAGPAVAARVTAASLSGSPGDPAPPQGVSVPRATAASPPAGAGLPVGSTASASAGPAVVRREVPAPGVAQPVPPSAAPPAPVPGGPAPAPAGFVGAPVAGGAGGRAMARSGVPGAAPGPAVPERGTVAEARPSDPRIGLPDRTGALLALLALLAAVAGAGPLIAVTVLFGWMTVARTADRSVTALVVRRHRHGLRGSDLTVAAMTSPWHFVVGVLGATLTLLLPLAVGVCAMFSAAFVLAGATSGQAVPAATIPAIAGGVFMALTAWWGPGGASLRRGSRSVVRGVTVNGAMHRVLVIVCVVAALALVSGSMASGGPSWWPYAGSPGWADQLKVP
jgi:predicted Ser/Thr protein kinase